jgi:hypothetical protein
MSPRQLRIVVMLSLAAEIVTALALLAVPDAVAQLLLAQSLGQGGDALGRMLGVGLLALVIACWPDAKEPWVTRGGIRALLAYNLLATAYLGGLGLTGYAAGILLWPAVAAHAAVSVLLAYGRRRARAA